MRVMVTGGAGFIGSFVVEALTRRGHEPVVVDSLHPQVHPTQEWPTYLQGGVEVHRADMRNPEEYETLLESVEAVIHLAARVGVGQSAYEIADYIDHNVNGTGQLLQAMSKAGTIKRLIVAGSMSSYGEGLYVDPFGVEHQPGLRLDGAVTARQFDHQTSDGAILSPVPTPESKRLDSTSFYALTKREQEDLCLLWGEQFKVPTLACRFFNCYGPRQALSNPYTGVAAIFTTRIRGGNAPMVYEDGQQTRDFIHVVDLAEAVVQLMETDAEGSVNIGTGEPTSILALAHDLLSICDRDDLGADVRGLFRAGDIRHCFADISRLQKLLPSWSPRPLKVGLADLMSWVEHQPKISDSFDQAHQELLCRGLLR